MIPSLKCAKLTKDSEGLELHAYQDSGGVWTIGWGHTGADVKPGAVITEAEAETLLMDDLTHAGNAVNRRVTVQLSENEFDALTDFTFNLGEGALAGSTLLKLVNQSKMIEASEEFGKWVHAGGKVLPGLVKRRAAEQELFLTP
jgi:lysozyme